MTVMPHEILRQQDTFGHNEPGLTHPVQNTHIRLRDNGDMELIVGDAVAMVMSNTRRSITFVADNIKFMTKEQNGLRWNDLGFNPKASKFEQPTFLQLTHEAVVDLYNGFDTYVSTSKDPNSTNPAKGV